MRTILIHKVIHQSSVGLPDIAIDESAAALEVDVREETKKLTVTLVLGQGIKLGDYGQFVNWQIS